MRDTPPGRNPSRSGPSAQNILTQLAAGGVDVNRVQTLLYAAPLLGSISFRRQMKQLDARLAAAERCLGDAIELLTPIPGHCRPKQLVALRVLHKQIEAELQRHSQFPKISKVELRDWVIAWLAKELHRVGINEVNAGIATLLSAANIPSGGRDERGSDYGLAWSAAAVKQRRRRFEKNPLVVHKWPTLFDFPQPAVHDSTFWNELGRAFQAHPAGDKK